MGFSVFYFIFGIIGLTFLILGRHRQKNWLAYLGATMLILFLAVLLYFWLSPDTM